MSEFNYNLHNNKFAFAFLLIYIMAICICCRAIQLLCFRFGTSYKIINSLKYVSIDNLIIECSICLEDNNNSSIVLECGHKFHKKCINNWIKECRHSGRHSSCPLCKNIIRIN